MKTYTSPEYTEMDIVASALCDTSVNGLGMETIVDGYELNLD